MSSTARRRSPPFNAIQAASAGTNLQAGRLLPDTPLNGVSRGHRGDRVRSDEDRRIDRERGAAIHHTLRRLGLPELKIGIDEVIHRVRLLVAVAFRLGRGGGTYVGVDRLLPQAETREDV